VSLYNIGLQLKARLIGFTVTRRIGPPSIKNGIVIGWCGMRGIVTLAAAFALPDAFPYRDLILLSAFAVVLGTLLIQGLTLKALIIALKFPGDDPVGREVIEARTVAFRAAIETIDGDSTPEAELLRAEYRTLLARTDADPEGQASGELPADPLRRRAIEAARQAIFKLRNDAVIGDDAFHRIEEELDWAELGAHAARLE
jgi:CPA1 family monovalent cation:H+ antiporter